MKTLLVVLALLWWTGGAAAQCCGDCAGDGVVTIDDLIKAVNNALLGCNRTPPPTAAATRTATATIQPTATPTPTATTQPTTTRRPTATRTPFDRCAFTFHASGINLCAFRGSYNRGCGGELNSVFSSTGTTVVVTIATNLPNPPTVSFSANVTSGTRAALTGWSTNDFQTVNPTAGTVELNDNRSELVVFPNDPPFMIQGCNFVQYVGEYVSRSIADAGVSGDTTSALALAEARQGEPIPELALP
jgi:hypothetical protein